MMIMGKETAADAVAIEALLDREFGPGRHLKTCQRLRDGQTPASDLALVMRDGDDLVGTLRFWDILIGGQTRALLLGPLAIDARLHGTGLGSHLMRRGLTMAAALHHRAVILVGDEPYYRRFGFEQRFTTDMTLPGSVERARFLGLELTRGALAAASGAITPLRQAAVPYLVAHGETRFGGLFDPEFDPSLFSPAVPVVSGETSAQPALVAPLAA